MNEWRLCSRRRDMPAWHAGSSGSMWVSVWICVGIDSPRFILYFTGFTRFLERFYAKSFVCRYVQSSFVVWHPRWAIKLSPQDCELITELYRSRYKLHPPIHDIAFNRVLTLHRCFVLEVYCQCTRSWLWHRCYASCTQLETWITSVPVPFFSVVLTIEHPCLWRHLITIQTTLFAEKWLFQSWLSPPPTFAVLLWSTGSSKRSNFPTTPANTWCCSSTLWICKFKS